MAGQCCWPPHWPRDGVLAGEMGVLTLAGDRRSMFLEKFRSGGGMWSLRRFPLQGTCSKDTGTKRDHLWVGQWSPGKAVVVLVADNGQRRECQLLLHCFCTCAGGKKQLCSCFAYCLACRALEHVSFSRGKILSLQCCIVMKCFQPLFGFFLFFFL